MLESVIYILIYTIINYTTYIIYFKGSFTFILSVLVFIFLTFEFIEKDSTYKSFKKVKIFLSSVFLIISTKITLLVFSSFSENIYNYLDSFNIYNEPSFLQNILNLLLFPITWGIYIFVVPYISIFSSFLLTNFIYKRIVSQNIYSILNKYKSKKREIDKECLDNLNSIKGSTQGIKFTKYSVTHPIDACDHKKEVILYDDNINKYDEKDFIFEGDNEEKVEYFEDLQSHLNQYFKVDDVIDLKDQLRSFYKVSKLKITCNILNDLIIDDENKFSIDDIISRKLGSKLPEKMELFLEKQKNNNLNIKNLINSEFIYDDVNEIFELRKSFKNYLECRSKDIEELMKAANSGKEGEDIVNNYLKQYDVEFINLPNIRLEIDGNSIENDNILITRHGIFVIEVKNLSPEGKYSIEIEKDGRWLKHFSNNKQEIIKMDATRQNDRHIAYLNKFINRELGRSLDNYIHAKGIVVIANDKIKIKNNSNQHVYRFTEIYRHITEKPVIFTQKEMEKIEKIILANNLQSKKFDLVDFIKEIDHNVLYFDRKTRDIDVNYLNNVKDILDLYKDKIESLNEEFEKDLSDIV